jgi:hypothetical protein
MFLKEAFIINLMLYIFRAVDYHVNLLIKPTIAQLHLYTLLHVSAVIIRPSSGRTFFLTKQHMVHQCLLIFIFTATVVLKAYVKIIVGIHRKRF